jgi:hypothetical protein
MQQTTIMHIKIHDGTVSNSDSNLCGTCRHATITRGQTLDEEIVQCHAATMQTTRITFKVTFCSSHADVRQPSYMEMLQDAWILQPASKKRPAGFVRASDLREQELRVIIADLHARSDD